MMMMIIIIFNTFLLNADLISDWWRGSRLEKLGRKDCSIPSHSANCDGIIRYCPIGSVLPVCMYDTP